MTGYQKMAILGVALVATGVWLKNPQIANGLAIMGVVVLIGTVISTMHRWGDWNDGGYGD